MLTSGSWGEGTSIHTKSLLPSLLFWVESNYLPVFSLQKSKLNILRPDVSCQQTSSLILSDPDKSLFHGSGSNPGLAESCWNKFPAPALFSGVWNNPMIKILRWDEGNRVPFLAQCLYQITLKFCWQYLAAFPLCWVLWEDWLSFFFLNPCWNKKSWISDKCYSLISLSLLGEALQASW